MLNPCAYVMQNEIGQLYCCKEQSNKTGSYCLMNFVTSTERKEMCKKSQCMLVESRGIK